VWSSLAGARQEGGPYQDRARKIRKFQLETTKKSERKAVKHLRTDITQRVGDTSGFLPRVLVSTA